MSKREQNYRYILRRRVNHLEERIAAHEFAGKVSPYDELELAALRWLIGLAGVSVERMDNDGNPADGNDGGEA